MTRQPISPRRERLVLVTAAVLVIVATVWLTRQRDDARDEAGQAVERAETAEQYVARIDADCRGASGPALARELQRTGRCPAAKRITQEAPVDPVPVVAGQDGRDGANGEDGKDGKDGKDGADGAPGASAAGADGADGADGRDAPRLVSPTINDAGDLVLTYSDGTVFNAGRVRGRDGADAVPPDLSSYATQAWVLDLIRALGCEASVGPDFIGPPPVLSCNVTGKP